MRVVAGKRRHSEAGLRDAPLKDGQEKVGEFAIITLL
jgi:hypothetical protein